MRKLVAAVACRAGGSRLYGKPLQNLDIEKRQTVIDHLIELLQTEPSISKIVLGVSEGPENEPFHLIARRHGIESIEGDREDVLMRLIQCGEKAGATDTFRITSESPFPYYEAIPDAWRRHQVNGNDMTQVVDVPDGSGFEIHRLAALKASHERGDTRHRSEHCSLYIREHPEDFQIETLDPPSFLRRKDLRLTIDFPEDLILCRGVYDRFRLKVPKIPLAGIIEFLDARPDLVELTRPYVASPPI